MFTKKVLATPKSRHAALMRGKPIGNAHPMIDVPAEDEPPLAHLAILHRRPR